MLAERGAAPPAALLEALRRHSIEPLRCESPFVAFARLCELSAASPGVPVALLLVQPERLPEGDALRIASERYTPSATCWVYDESGKPRLRAAPPVRPRTNVAPRHEKTGSAQLPAAPKPERPKPAPRLRLVESDGPAREPDMGLVGPGDDLAPISGANPDTPTGVGTSAGVPRSARSILTDDELEMLMAPELPDDGRG